MNINDYKDKKLIGEGEYSKCYEIPNNEVLKVFNVPRKLYTLEKFEYFKDYTNDSFLFPYSFIYDEENFYGYISKKAHGKTLSSVIDDYTFKNLSKNSIKLQENIDYISEGKILMNDVHQNNVMYDGNIFEVIDADFYDIWSPDNVDRIKKTNAKSHRMMIIDLFLVPFFRQKKQYSHKYIVDKIKSYRFTDIKVNELILELQNDLENYYKEEITKLSSLEKVLRR